MNTILSAVIRCKLNGFYQYICKDADGNELYQHTLPDGFSLERSMKAVIEEGTKEMISSFIPDLDEEQRRDIGVKTTTVEILLKGEYFIEFEWLGRTARIEFEDFSFSGTKKEYAEMIGAELWLRLKFV